MIKLIINTSESKQDKTSFGGAPVCESGQSFNWPTCRTCDLPMQYLGKIATDLGLEQIFMCQNDPGCCDEWEADGGGNAVLVCGSQNVVAVVPPAQGETTRNCEHGAEITEVDADNYDDARDRWAEQHEGNYRQVLGQLYGTPKWLQADETPICSGCGGKMRFVAQLEQGPDWETEMNFGGGGCGYLFDCKCNNSAKFLWQC